MLEGGIARARAISRFPHLGSVREMFLRQVTPLQSLGFAFKRSQQVPYTAPGSIPSMSPPWFRQPTSPSGGISVEGVRKHLPFFHWFALVFAETTSLNVQIDRDSEFEWYPQETR